MEAVKKPARWVFFVGLGVFLVLLVVQFYLVGEHLCE